jgi:glycosyltransferase involved in cell wall biosynthesis
MSSDELSAEPLVSVVIAAYNGAQYLPEAIDSALAQTYPKVEVIVVDDGSTDSTAEVVGAYGARVRYLYQQNAGTAAARNTGIQSAQGELIALLDQDDRWLPEKLARQVPLFFDEPRVGLVHSGGIRRADGSNNQYLQPQAQPGRARPPGVVRGGLRHGGVPARPGVENRVVRRFAAGRG